jgi:hypothetical protein
MIKASDAIGRESGDRVSTEMGDKVILCSRLKIVEASVSRVERGGDVS